jgi:hypothetical protein
MHEISRLETAATFYYYYFRALCWAFIAFSGFDPIYSHWDSLDGGSARRKTPT